MRPTPTTVFPILGRLLAVMLAGVLVAAFGNTAGHLIGAGIVVVTALPAAWYFRRYMRSVRLPHTVAPTDPKSSMELA